MVGAVAEIAMVNEFKDFSRERLVGADLSRRVFRNCNFDGADLTDANCSFSDFTGSSFVGSICYETNFHRAVLAAVKWDPKDCYGVTITMKCSTFRNAEFGQLWWYSFLMFVSMMFPMVGPVKDDLRGKLIALIGADRYVKLTELFKRREF